MTPEEITAQAIARADRPELNKLVRLAVRHIDCPFVAADVWDELDIDESLYSPHAMGSAIQKCAKDGLIVKTDNMNAKARNIERRKRNHNRLTTEWTRP